MRIAVVAGVLCVSLALGCQASFDASFDLVLPSPTARRIYAGPLTRVVPVHPHGAGCGHANVWFDGHETYREAEGWVFYSPSRRGWMRYDDPPRKLVARGERAR